MKEELKKQIEEITECLTTALIVQKNIQGFIKKCEEVDTEPDWNKFCFVIKYKVNEFADELQKLQAKAEEEEKN